MDRAAQLTEQVENNRPFYEWVKANNKQPEYFANWNEVITEYYQSIGEKWTGPVPVPSPYGYLGYDFIKPPVPPRRPNEGANGEIIFACEKKTQEWTEEELFNLMCTTDSDDESDSSDEEGGNFKCGCQDVYAALEEEKQPEETSTEEKTPVDTPVKKLTLEDVLPGT
ncbi:MAG: hypothetical protein GY915_04270, partial [bacterium]|nr:hypothetical protein [bacterium]